MTAPDPDDLLERLRKSVARPAAPDPAEAEAGLRRNIAAAHAYGSLSLNERRIEAVLAELERLRVAVALHRPHPYPGCIHCAECDAFWPCPTARAAGAT